MASVVFFPSYSFSQEAAVGEIFEVNAPVDVGYVLDGGDKLLVTNEGSIDIITGFSADAVLVSGGANNVIENAGRMSISRLNGEGNFRLVNITPASTDTVVENSGNMEVTEGGPGGGHNTAIHSVDVPGDLTVINHATGEISVNNPEHNNAGNALGIEYKGLGDLTFTNAGTVSVKAKDTHRAMAFIFEGRNLDVDISGTATMELETGQAAGAAQFATLNSGINDAASPSHRKIDISGSVLVRGIDKGSVYGLWNDAANLTMNISGSFTGTTEQGTVTTGIRSSASDFVLNIASSGKFSVSSTGRSVIKALEVGGNAAQVNSAGSIMAVSEDAGLVYGMTMSGLDASVVNSGSIFASTTGDGTVYGLHSTGARMHIINSGRMSAVSGTSGVYGIRVVGEDATVVNSGSISTSALADGLVYGIRSTGARTRITNSGSINAVTTGTSGVYGVSLSDGGSLINSGTITSSGTGRHDPLASYAVGGSGIITISNSGSIIGSVKHDIPAINLIGGGGSLEFGRGSFIVGRMLLRGDTDTSISIDGEQPRSLHYVFEGDGRIIGGKPQVFGSSPVFYSAAYRAKEIAILDTGYLIAGIDALEVMTGNVSDLIRSRRFVQDDSKSHVWVSGALSRRTSGENVNFFTADDEIKDFAVGVDGGSLASVSVGDSLPSLSVGGLVGANTSSLGKSGGNDMPDSYQRESIGMFGAVYAIQHFDRIFVQSALSVGFLKHENERFIQDNTVDSGIDIARSSYHSYWASPEVTLGVGISASDWTYTPSVNLRYAYQLVEAYREKGSKSNVNYDRRSIALFSGRAELAADRQFSSTHLTLRTGFQSFSLIGSNDVSFSMLDGPKQTFLLQSSVGQGQEGIYGGVDVAMQLSHESSVTFGGQALLSKEKKIHTRLTAGLDVAF